MKVRYIPTEEPQIEQWRLLSQFTHEANIRRYLVSHGLTASPAVVEYVSATIRQAHAYFLAARSSTLDISPLLAYYGASNLLSGAAALTTGAVPVIEGHGVSVDPPASGSLLGAMTIRVRSQATGAMSVFASSFGGGITPPVGSPWSLLQLFGSIPEIRGDFERSYPAATTYTVPLHTAAYRGASIDHVVAADMQRHPSPEVALSTIDGYAGMYLRPEVSGANLVLCRRLVVARDIRYESCLGGTYLLLSHSSGSRAVTPSVLVSCMCALFALGHLSRYYASIWVEAMRLDPNNERSIIERFVSVVERYIPNQILSFILGEAILFGPRPVSAPSIASSEEDLRRLIREELDAAK